MTSLSTCLTLFRTYCCIGSGQNTTCQGQPGSGPTNTSASWVTHRTPSQNVLFSIPFTAASPVSPHTCALAAGVRFLPPLFHSVGCQCFSDKVPDLPASKSPAGGSHAPFNSAAYAGHLQLQLSVRGSAGCHSAASHLLCPT